MNEELANDILYRHQGGQSNRGIARDLGLSRRSVARVIARQREARAQESLPAELKRPGKRRTRKLDAYAELTRQLLERYPKITVVRLLEELRREGYSGGYTQLREQVKELRVQPTRPLVVRFETAPGAQAQMDWSVYDIDFLQEGRRRVNLFSYLLGYSRRQYLRFTERQDFETLLREHVRAFEFLGGVAARCLYDNMKTVVTRWEDDEPVYNTRFLAFATHYGFQPRACRPFRPETKGKVERAFLYVRQSLLNGREFRSLDHLNEVTRQWLAEIADTRLIRSLNRRPLEAYVEEKPHLIGLPTHPYDTARVVYRVVDAEGFIREADNYYSVPWTEVGKLLPVRVTEDRLVVYDRHIRPLAEHALVRGQTGQRQRIPSHFPPKDREQQLRQLRAQFAPLGQIGSQFLEGLLKRQRSGLKQAQRVLMLQRVYQRADLVSALQRAVRHHAYAFSSLERILAAQAKPKPVWFGESHQELLEKLAEQDAIEPRASSAYQHLLLEEPDSQPDPPCDSHADPQFERELERQLDPPPDQELDPHEPTEERPAAPGANHESPGDVEHPPDEPAAG